MLVGFGLTTVSAQHVVLISIDGLRPEMYLDADWPTPNLQRLARQGMYSRGMAGVFPSYTYPTHVAMLSGALPARSGIAYNAPRDGNGDWHWYTKDVRVPLLWRALKGQGLTTAAVQWPVSVSDDITWNIPEIWDSRNPYDRITATRRHATPGLVEEIEQYATGRLDSANMDEMHLSMDANAARMGAYIFARYRPNLLAVHFASVDGTQHTYGMVHDSVRLAMANADHGIGVLLEAVYRSGLKDSTVIVVVGDHGFSDIHTVIRPNLLIKDLPARFTPAGGSAFLYVDERTVGQRRTAVVDSVVSRLDALPPELRDNFRLVGRAELDTLGADSAAVLALSANPGWVFSASAAPPAPGVGGRGTVNGLVGPVSGGHHGYDPRLPEMKTGLVIAGPGIRRGELQDAIRVTDIAPLIAKLLGVAFVAPDGKEIAVW